MVTVQSEYPFKCHRYEFISPVEFAAYLMNAFANNLSFRGM